MKKSSSYFKKIFKLKFFTNLFINEKQKTYKKNGLKKKRIEKIKKFLINIKNCEKKINHYS